MQPLIIPRKEHRISRKQVSPNAVRTLYRLHSNGFIAYLVGGCVRDLLLGRTPKDFDIATDARPGQIKRLFRNCRLIGRRFRLAHLHFQNEILEVSTFRSAAIPSDNANTAEEDQKLRHPWHLTDEDGMILMDNVFGTPEEDALRRDFTINALAYNIADFSVIDFSTGLSDLHQGLIRPIGDPRVRFTEDPVRMLRAVRFAASHGFTIEPVAWEGLCELSSIISRANPARLYEEILKLFPLGSARAAFILLEESGLLAALFPWLSRWITENDGRLMLLHTQLESLDRLNEAGEQSSLAFFLAALFGPSIEEMSLDRHRNGIPHQRAMDQIFSDFIKETCETVSIPGKIGIRMRAILDLQASLHRMPKRRPASVANRPEFPEALAYLRLAATRQHEYQPSLDWWNAFLVKSPSLKDEEPPTNQTPSKPRRKRRRKPRGSKDAT
jgi:poly(A) polymerase